jgi:hypothetical protein
MTPEPMSFRQIVQIIDRDMGDGWTQRLAETLLRLRCKDAAADICERGAMPKGRRYSVEPHGAGYAIYQGRDATHHGLNLGYLTEFDAGLPALIERALNGWTYSPAAKGERTTDGTPDASAIRERQQPDTAPACPRCEHTAAAFGLRSDAPDAREPEHASNDPNPKEVAKPDEGAP